MGARNISFLETVDPAKTNETGNDALDFVYFPDYASYLLEHKVYEVAAAQLEISRKIKIPLLRFFESFSDEQLLALGMENTRDILTFFSENKARELIESSVEKWISNQLFFISRNQINTEDITLVSFMRRKIFRDFLPAYTSDITLYVKIMEEVDRFTTEFDTVCFKMLINFQQELYRQVQSLAHIGNWRWDLKTKELTWSDEIFRIYGMNPQSELKDIASWNHPDDAAMIQEQMKISLETRQPHDFYYRIILKDGRRKILHAKGQVILNEENEPYEMFGTLQDVTEQKLNEQELLENRNLIRKIADVTPCIIAAYNLSSGKYIFINQALRLLLGYDVREAMEAGVDFFTELIHPDDRESLMKKNAAALEQANKILPSGDHEPIIEFRYRLKHANGEYRWFHTYGTIFNRNKHNEVEDILNISIDITEEYRLSMQLTQKDKEIRKNEERYHRMIAEVEDYAILLLDKDGFIRNWNKGAEKIKGYKADEIIGKNFRIFYTPHDQRSHLPEKLIEEAVQKGKATHEGWRVRKDGTTFWGYIVITALHDELNNVIGFSKVTRDLTERKMSEEKIKEHAADVAQKNEELQIINTELESFTYMASHDLQEPLRKIRTFTGFILNKADEELTPATKDYFNRIVATAGRMQTLIEDLLTYSRTNISDIQYEPTSLNEIIEEVKRNLSEAIEEKNAKIESDDLPVLHILPRQFLQLFTNLLDNAIKYNRENVPPVIKISSRKTDAKNILPAAHTKYVYKISVEDNGIGFENEYAEKIFGLFQRLHGQSMYPGTGIGLAICKKIVQNHKGIINAAGEPGKGATFNIYLPAE